MHNSTTLLSSADFLHELRLRGARRLENVVFRKNRNTIWSLTKNGRILNVHEAFRPAPAELLEAFALIAREGGLASAQAEQASRTLSEWPPLVEAIADLRREHDERRRSS